MKIFDFLKGAGKVALKEVPLGGMVVDAVGLLVEDKIDKDKVTAEDLLGKIESLPPEARERIYALELDNKLEAYKTWTDLRAKMDVDSPTSRTRAKITMVVVVFMLLTSFAFTLMIGHSYLTTGTLPSVEALLMVYGFPGIAVLGQFGLQTDWLQEIMAKSISNRINK